ncbi:MAG: hypothetical protein ABSG25_07575, partial [Bryobacteraceae bacterium]
MVGSAVFPYILVRLPVVPRSALHRLAYDRTLAWRKARADEDATPEREFLEDSIACDPEAVRLLQWPPFLDALIEANPELGQRVAGLRQAPAAELRKKERQTVRAALRYLWRAALRPIPHGGLCGTALGVLDEPWPEPAPDLSARICMQTFSSKRVSEAARLAWRVPAAGRRSRLYGSPLLWTGTDAKRRYWDAARNAPEEVPAALDPLLDALGREPGLAWSDAANIADEAAIRAGLECGLIEQYAAAPGEDERVALSGVLWQAAFGDLELLEPLAALSPEAAPPQGRKNPVKCDSCHAAKLGLAGVPGMQAFLAEMAELGAKIAEPASHDARIAGAVLRRIAPSGRPLPLLEFYGESRRVARGYGVEFVGPENWGALAAAMGISTDSVQARVPGWIERGATDSAVEFRLPREWRAARGEPRRISLRFRRARAGRFLLAHFGGDRMSLLPRYARLPFDDQLAFQRELRTWMNRWPEVWELYGGVVHDADAHDPPTSRVLHFPGTPAPPGSIALGSLMVAVRPEDGVPVLTDCEGVRIRPAFFGVTAEHALPASVRFALAIGNPEMTVVEGICRALRATLADVFLNLNGRVVALSEVTLGKTILLSPRLWMAPAHSLPDVTTPVGARDFIRFHDWLAKWNMPSRLVQAARPGREPQWV